MKKLASSEVTTQKDSQTGYPVYVSTTARMTFRKLHPEWAKVRNSVLNEEIAKLFVNAKVFQRFASKKSNEEGDIRGTDSSKFVSIYRNNYVLVIAAKGGHALPPPPTGPKKSAAASIPLTKVAQGRDDSLRAHRGWLEDHYFDLFIGQAALDAESEKALKDYVESNGGFKSIKGASPKEVAQKAGIKPSDSASQMARTMLSEDQRGQLIRDPGMLNDRPGNLSVPLSFPLE